MAENIVAPPISVVMPVYNGVHYIREAIDSILTQTFANFEFIIIDDASTDNTIDIIKSFKDERIILLTKEKNSGITDSLNIGVEAARGMFIARMDADDISYKDRFKQQFDYMEKHTDVLVLGSHYKTIGTDRISNTLPISSEEVKLFALTQCPLAHPTAFIRNDIFNEYGLRYNKETLHAEDYDLWTRILEKGKVENLPMVLLEYRRHDGQVSTIHLKKQTEATNVIRLRQLKKLISFSNKKYTEDFALIIIQKDPFGITSDEMVILSLFIDDMWKANEVKKTYEQKLFKDFLHDIWAFYLTKLSGYRFKNVTVVLSDTYHIKENKSTFLWKYLAGSLWGLRRKL